MSQPVYLVVLFDEAKDPLPSNAQWEYVDKSRWQLLQDENIKGITLDSGDYEIVKRRSFRMDDLSGPRLVSVIDIKKKSELPAAKHI